MVIDKALFSYDDKNLILRPGKSVFEEKLFVEFLTENTNSGGTIIKLNIHPKVPITIHKLQLFFTHPYGNDASVFCNGYQSWTESREFGRDELIQPLRKVTSKLFNPYGDYGFTDYPGLSGHLHSWSYTYISEKENEIIFLGSTSEFTGFTLFRHEAPGSTLIVEKDCRGLFLDHSYPAINLFSGKGDRHDLFNEYFELMDFKPTHAKPAFGWTSWYEHYTSISHQIIEENLEAAANSGLPVDIFQVDDGYQTRVGDWTDIKPEFPEGMGAIAAMIKAKGIKAGIWLAPFICEKKSNIFRFKKDWLLKDKKGRPIKAGYNPLWSGDFYALDFYNQEVKNHLTAVFFTVLSQWKFDMVKLDFLYAVALHPPKNKTRGQVMHEAMSFLRKVIESKLILGCGVPLSAAFGTTDYCRIGADVHLKWEHGLLKWLRNRERVSTHLALTNTFGRYELNKLAFLNDPDVFILRKHKNKLTETQQRTLLLANVLAGDLVFSSDNFSLYDEETLTHLREILALFRRTHLRIEKQEDFYIARFKVDGKDKVAYFNLSGKEIKKLIAGVNVELEPYASKLVHLI
ncbi:MAG: glycoside hydrolase family 36 protein [Bacteroidota bacterium]